MLSIRVRMFLLVLFFLSVPASQVMANDKRPNEGSGQKYIDTKDISAMKGGYPLQVKGVGKVQIVSVRSGRAMHVDKRGLRNKIIRHFKGLSEGGLDGKTAMELKSLSQNEGDVVICYPQGPNSPICYIISCTYDPDSAVLPCL